MPMQTVQHLIFPFGQYRRYSIYARERNSVDHLQEMFEKHHHLEQSMKFDRNE